MSRLITCLDGDGAELRQGVVHLQSGVDRRTVLVEVCSWLLTLSSQLTIRIS